MSQTFIIAEVGVNHNGSVNIAKKMIDTAKACGVDAVKFQTFVSENLVSRFAEKAEYQKETTGKDESQLAQVLRQEVEEIKRCAFQSIDLTAMAELALAHTYKDCIFIGCQLPMGLKKNSKDCLFLPDMGETFRYRNHLYTPEELYEGYSPAIKGSYEKCFDGRVYKHYLKKGKRSTDAKETLARTLHDHSISGCLHDFLSNYDERSLVGIMGGHHLSRRDTAYRQVATISKSLTEKGYLMKITKFIFFSTLIA